MEKSAGAGTFSWRFLAVFALSLVLLVIGGLVIRNRLQTEGVDADREGGFELKGVSLKADPNRVPSGSEGVKTTITWSTPDNAFVQVFVSRPGGTEEKLFAEGGHGSKEVNWILPGKHYEFRMYAGKEKKELLAVLKIPKK